jgi:hypothetical protein
VRGRWQLEIGAKAKMRLGLAMSALIVFLTLGAQGCGKRASLDNPAEAKADKAATAQSGQGKPEGAGAGPHRPFILDGLIR